MDNLTICDSKCKQCKDHRRLTINGVEFCSGDNYHNKIDDYILGFYDGLKYANVTYNVEKQTHECEFSCED